MVICIDDGEDDNNKKVCGEVSVRSHVFLLSFWVSRLVHADKWGGKSHAGSEDTLLPVTWSCSL